ncbi:hypothetical protein BDW74DRAFT_89434 [Aspergillus multicolor]|uniref:uncharacterized protein n=1 Tax=Aspergillus multicolor TaxID=41759 RepID=UPI003CCD7E96
MFTKSFITLCALASTGMAVSNTINFVYSASSFSGIQNSGNSYSEGFNLIDGDGNVLYNSDYPDGYSPCMSDSNNIKITSDCWSGTYTFRCTSAFDGSPESCSVVDADGNETTGEADESLSFTGISAGIDGTCGGVITTDSDAACSSDSAFTIEGRYRGDYDASA